MHECNDYTLKSNVYKHFFKCLIMRKPSCLCALNEEWHKHIAESLIKLNIQWYTTISMQKKNCKNMKIYAPPYLWKQMNRKPNIILSFLYKFLSCLCRKQKTKAYKTQRRLSLLRPKRLWKLIDHSDKTRQKTTPWLPVEIRSRRSGDGEYHGNPHRFGQSSSCNNNKTNRKIKKKAK